jgi:hypothetical protein
MRLVILRISVEFVLGLRSAEIAGGQAKSHLYYERIVATSLHLCNSKLKRGEM